MFDLTVDSQITAAAAFCPSPPPRLPLPSHRPWGAPVRLRFPIQGDVLFLFFLGNTFSNDWRALLCFRSSKEETRATLARLPTPSSVRGQANYFNFFLNAVWAVLFFFLWIHGVCINLFQVSGRSRDLSLCYAVLAGRGGDQVEKVGFRKTLFLFFAGNV